ncbi:GAF domain-containing sensor histidine kinase [Actinopolymorpha singaporensis]|uniref:Histidine kinase n=1 Tax=Actinopolymorpha singaporensis TaxID=117157 RepID=A0A1H1Y9Z1_9ACTN|nr:GAF domain-containing protein [Actinopolymorpha singaporensis]SDT18247.1 Histidine kinase [Actinopolymorpha singaporensis]
MVDGWSRHADRNTLVRLVEAIVDVGSQVDVETVGTRVAAAAARLAGARTAIVRLTSGTTARTFRHGVGADDAARLLAGPELTAARGLLAKSDEPVHRPGLLALLLPAADTGSVAGELYLLDRRDTSFSADDEAAVTVLGTAAVTALHNAERYETERRRQRWLRSTAELTHQLLGRTNRREALDLLVTRLRQVSGADFGGLLLLDPANPGTVVLEAAQGAGLADTTGGRAPLRGLTAKVVSSGQSMVSEDLRAVPGYNPPPAWHAALANVGVGMLTPLTAEGEVLGVLFAGWQRDSQSEGLTVPDVAPVEMFASQAALALRHQRAQEARIEQRVLEDRDRIAQDLHERVIRRLFDVSAKLHLVASLRDGAEVGTRVERAIGDLDAATREVRGAIFALTGPPPGTHSLHADLLAAIDRARERFGIVPRLVVHGPLESVPQPVRAELLAAARAAFDRIEEAGPPSRLQVEVRAAQGEVRLRVTYSAVDEPPGGLAYEQTATDWQAPLGEPDQS